MSCTFTTGISLGCKDSVGGVRNLYLTSSANVASITNSAPDDGVITAVTMSGSTKFYTFALHKNAATFNQKVTVNPETGTNFTTQTITASFTKMDATKRNLLKILAQARLVGVVEDQNGIYWYVGEINGLDATEVMANAGKAKGDMNGYTITLIGEEPNQAQTLDATYVTTSSTGFLAANVA